MCNGSGECCNESDNADYRNKLSGSFAYVLEKFGVIFEESTEDKGKL
jgi:hypothetical protein